MSHLAKQGADWNGHRCADVAGITSPPPAKGSSPFCAVNAPRALQGRHREEIAAAAGRKGVGDEVAGKGLLNPAGRAASLVAPFLEQDIGPLARSHLFVDRIGSSASKHQNAIDTTTLRPTVVTHARGSDKGGERLSVEVEPPWRVGIAVRQRKARVEVVNGRRERDAPRLVDRGA